MNEWKLTFDNWDIKDQKAREALCTLGNGYWATRGAFEEATQHDGHYPGTYLAGVYDRCERIIAGETVSHETIVNWPNWLYLTFAMDNGQWFSMEQVQVNTYRQELDLQRGVLSRYIQFTEPKGRETILHTIRLVHMEHPHLATLQWTFTPLNWSGRLHVRTALDSGISNENVDRYREMNTKHFRLLDSGFHKQGWLYVVTKHFNLTFDWPRGFERTSRAAISSFNGIFRKWIPPSKNSSWIFKSRLPYRLSKPWHSTIHGIVGFPSRLRPCTTAWLLPDRSNSCSAPIKTHGSRYGI